MNDLEYLKKYNKGNLEDALKRLESGEPIQYIVGNVDFYHSNFIVNESVLIPRFETEELVDKTINYIKEYFRKPIDIIDLGTGSGCIAISLKKELNCNMSAVDISECALEVAKENAKKNKVDIDFYLSDFFESLPNKKYDVIISNPPYISTNEEIMDIVKNNEPSIALYASNDGLSCYESILKNAKKYLKEKSIIAFEIGFGQGEKVKNIATKYLPNSIVTIEKDFSEKDRYVFIFNNIVKK